MSLNPVFTQGVTSTKPVYASWGGNTGFGDASKKYVVGSAPATYGPVLNQAATFGAAATQAEQQAAAAIQAQIAAAQGGVNTASGAAVAAQGTNNLSIDALRGMQTGIAGAQAGATNVRGMADALRPYMDTLGQYGSQMYQQGNALFGQGQDVLGQGQSLLNLDTNGTGVAARYAQWLNSLDPNAKVSQATADTQASFQNAQGQMDRTLSRSGVSAGSGQAVTRQQQWAQTLAATLSGVKTRARQLGLETQGNALKDALSAAQSLISTGGGLSAQGVAAENSAGGMQSAAAQVGAQAGNLYGQAGQLDASSASLGAQQASGFSQVAQSLVASGQLSMSAAKALSDAQNNAAQYYAAQAQGYAQLAGSGGLIQSLFAV